MSAGPEVIWLWDAHEGLQYGLTESAWARHKYLRSSPELEALIERALNYVAIRMETDDLDEASVNREMWTRIELQDAALALARKETPNG